MVALFEKEFKYSFYPVTTDGVGYEHTSLPNAPTGLYLYNGLPTRTDALAGVSSGSATIINTISNSWVDTDDGYGKTITIPKIVDPEPNSTIIERVYYLAIRFVLVGSTNPLVLIRQIKLRRLQAHEAVLTCTVSDLLKCEPMLSRFCPCKGDLETYIESAKAQIISEFKSKLSNYRDVYDPSVLKPLVVLLAISKFFHGVSLDTNDITFIHGDRYYEMFREQKKSLNVEFDTDNNGTLETTKNYGSSSSFRFRT